ncbi:HAD hydrolase-like protein, partial [Candidatus Dojkabacteria bacterium]|nr:HAD hydrolase-like protein [Candidatus Dojkabacteria bacterium]
MIKAIIFDFDGVFVDSWAFHVDVMLDGCGKLGIETTKEELTEVFFGKTLKEAT